MRLMVLAPIAPPGHRYGTEIVACDVAAGWAEAGHEVTLAGPGTTDGAAGLDGVRVRPFPPGPPPDRLRHVSRRSDLPPALIEAVRETRPEKAVVVGFGPGGITLTHMEHLRDMGVEIGLWHHVPGITCQQHGLRLKNRTVCDGEVRIGRCAACRLTAAGLPEPLAEAASRLPGPVSAVRLPGPAGHVLGGRALSAVFARSVGQLVGLVSRVFVGADWVRPVLMRNGVGADRISLVRPGLRRDFTGTGQAKDRAPGPLRLIYWGRIDDTKGIDVAIRAVRLSPADVRFEIVGRVDQGVPFHRHLTTLADGDPRIVFAGRLEAGPLAARLAAADVAVIPSVWPETGPLTAFEAHAAGLPILGSDIGGIGEIAGADPSARTFPRGDAAALARLIEELATDPAELARRCALVPRARTMTQVAAEMAEAMGFGGGK